MGALHDVLNLKFGFERNPRPRTWDSLENFLGPACCIKKQQILLVAIHPQVGSKYLQKAATGAPNAPNDGRLDDWWRQLTNSCRNVEKLGMKSHRLSQMFVKHVPLQVAIVGCMTSINEHIGFL